MTYIEFLNLSTWLSPLISLIGLTIGFSSFRTLNIVNKGITVYLAVMFFVDIGSRIIHYFQPSNIVGFPVYCLIELSLFTYFYHKYFFKTKYKALLGLNILGMLYIIWDIATFSFTSAKDFQSYAKVFDNFGIILLALTYCYEKLNQPDATKWENFRLNIIILLFFTINLILFLPYNFIINDNNGIQFYFWQAIIFTTISFYIYLITLIWQDAKKIKGGSK